MSWLWTTCGFNADGRPSLTLIKQHSGVDGDFYIASVVGTMLKQNWKVMLIAAHQSYYHYNMASGKLGTFLDPYRKTTLDVVDLVADPYLTYPTLNKSLSKVGDQIQTIYEDDHLQVLVVIDDLSYFLNIGECTELQLLDFVEKIMPPRHVPYKERLLLLKVNNAELYKVLGSNLEDMADREISIEPLSSGNFTEVDGKITVKARTSAQDRNQLIDVKKQEDSFLYKVQQREVRRYVPGMFGIRQAL